MGPVRVWNDERARYEYGVAIECDEDGMLVQISGVYTAMGDVVRLYLIPRFKRIEFGHPSVEFIRPTPMSDEGKRKADFDHSIRVHKKTLQDREEREYAHEQRLLRQAHGG